MTARIVPEPPRANDGSRVRPSHIRLYHLSDLLTEPLIYLLLVASPWAFGTTQPFVVRLMDIGGYALGGLFLIKLYIRHGAGYAPITWRKSGAPTVSVLTRALGILAVAILGYCLISALNARSEWKPQTNSFDYFTCVAWLPHSYDRTGTWQSFWNYSALACVFWAVHDWLLGLTPAEEQSQRAVERGVTGAFRAPVFIPARLRRLLWLLSVNGALLGLEGIAQRLSGTNKLLWLASTHINRDALDQFGPYAYRSNAAQYFNLVWPITLAFWWTLHRDEGLRHLRHHWLLVCAAIMAACPVIATTRGGALVTGGLIVSSAAFLLLSSIFFRSRQKTSPRATALTFGVLCAFFVCTAWLAIHFGWSNLQLRMIEINQDYVAREDTYQTARQIAHDYQLFGTGPGTFNPLFQLYRSSPEEYWPAQLHNDWLETRITWGWLGSGMIALALLIVIARWFAPGGIHGGRRFVGIVWLGLLGCLIHARFDFPFQIYSIVLLFVVICAILFALSRRTRA